MNKQIGEQVYLYIYTSDSMSLDFELPCDTTKLSCLLQTGHWEDMVGSNKNETQR